MDQTQQLTLDESVKQVMQTLPPPIREYLASGKYSIVANSLMTKYGLRVDQGGVLEREIMLLLMGIENPTEFTKSLDEEAHLDQKTINSISQDVNNQIFMPLREQLRRQTGSEPRPQASGMRSGATATPTPARPSAPVNVPVPSYTPASPQAAQSTARPATASKPTGVVGPPPQSPTYFHLENKLSSPLPVKEVPRQTPPPVTARPIAPAQPSVNILSTESKQSLPVSDVRPLAPEVAPLPPKVVLPHVPEALKGGMQSVVPAVTTESPLRQALRTVISPENLPGALPPLTTSFKPYSTDPYHEPIDEK